MPRYKVNFDTPLRRGLTIEMDAPSKNTVVEQLQEWGKTRLFINSCTEVKETTKRISLNEEDFTRLVSGEIIKKDDVEFCLQDIGYMRMLDIIEQKLDELNKTERT